MARYINQRSFDLTLTVEPVQAGMVAVGDYVILRAPGGGLEVQRVVGVLADLTSVTLIFGADDSATFNPMDVLSTVDSDHVEGIDDDEPLAF